MPYRRVFRGVLRESCTERHAAAKSWPLMYAVYSALRPGAPRHERRSLRRPPHSLQKDRWN